MGFARTLVLGAAGLVTLVAACGESEPQGAVSIAEVVDDVEYYIGCANEPVTVAGTVWWPLAESDFEDEVADILAVDRAAWPGARGFAPRIVAPGPGDDIGTLVVWADGFARYQSDSGQSIWLTREEQTYNWVC